MTDRITARLERLFEEHRIVFWYDAARDMRGEFDAVELAGVTKVEIANNQFGLKHRVLRQEPKTKFLVFHDGPEPGNAANWLLDLQLATAVFKADQAGIWLGELGLPPQFEGVVRDHMEFYRSKVRVAELKRLLHAADTQSQVRLHMLAVCAGAEGGLDTVVEALLGDLAKDSETTLRLIERVGLADFLWKSVKDRYGYESDTPDWEDFALSLFESAYLRALGEDGRLTQDALVDFRRWKNNRHYAEVFETLSERFCEVLGVKKDLLQRDFRKLIDLDHHEEIDRHIIRQIVHAMATQTVGAADVLGWVRKRRQSHWYERYHDIYTALARATEFQQALAAADLSMSSIEDGFKRYAANWYVIDQKYRQFSYHMRKSGQATLLADLFASIENRYLNSYCRPLNDAWQDQVSHLERWKIPKVLSQQDFYIQRAAEYRRRDQKIAVIVSDALRFEVAEECLGAIQAMNRYEADLTPMLAALPSYTQLGMASLLPNKDLEVVDEPSATVHSYGDSSQGLLAREKLLEKGRKGDRVKAILYADLINLVGEDAKALFRDHDIVYIFHNQIDSVGDKLQSEDRVFDAVASTIDELTKAVRKLTSANFSNILITADHGFLFQAQPLEDSEYLTTEPKGKAVLLRNRRFVVGKGFTEQPGFKTFSAEQLGLKGNLEFAFPNSINRLRLKGAGSRYVHGGASLQEVVLPVLRVGKRREADVEYVDVQIIVPGKHVISAAQTAVIFYQAEAVTKKKKARPLVAGIFTEDGILISDQHELLFDFESEAAREREMPRKFLLSRQADSYNNQTVYLKLQERVGKTSRFTDYATHRFDLRRGTGMELDFDL